MPAIVCMVDLGSGHRCALAAGGGRSIAVPRAMSGRQLVRRSGRARSLGGRPSTPSRFAVLFQASASVTRSPVGLRPLPFWLRPVPVGAAVAAWSHTEPRHMFLTHKQAENALKMALESKCNITATHDGEGSGGWGGMNRP